MVAAVCQFDVAVTIDRLALSQIAPPECRKQVIHHGSSADCCLIKRTSVINKIGEQIKPSHDGHMAAAPWFNAILLDFL
jgi:hypothetical protein